MINIKQKSVEAALMSEYINGFGFQVDGDILTLASISKSNDNQKGGLFGSFDERAEFKQKLRKQSNTSSVTFSGQLGRVMVEIHWKEWSSIPTVIQAFLDARYRVRLQINGHPTFEPGEQFTFDLTESKIIALLRREKEQFGNWSDVYTVERQTHVFLKHYNWHTPAGKELCSEMRAELKPTKPVAVKLDRYSWSWFDGVCLEHRILHHGDWSSFVPSGLDVNTPIPIAKPPTNKVAAESTGLPIRVGEPGASKTRVVSQQKE